MRRYIYEGDSTRNLIQALSVVVENTKSGKVYLLRRKMTESESLHEGRPMDSKI